MRAATESSAHLFHSLVGLGVQHPVVWQVLSADLVA